MTVVIAVVLAVVMACSRPSHKEPEEQSPRRAEVAKVPPAAPPPLQFVGEPVKQAADFPVERWVRTTIFGSQEPFIGFTYRDRSKGNSIKGVPAAKLSKAELAEKLKGVPTHTLQPIPAGHPITLLTPAEIAELHLPAAPDWLGYFK